MSDIISKILNARVGGEIDPSTLSSLIVDGRIEFPYKPTSGPSNISSSGEDDSNVIDSEVDRYIDEVKKNEDIVKTLEDMYNDLTKDMKIPPVSNRVAAAAKQLGSEDGTITKKILDRAEAILDMLPYTSGIGNPVIGALTGDPTLDSNFVKCSDVTKAFADSFKLGVNGKTASEILNNQSSTQESVKDSFDKKMKKMFRYIMAKLWWEEIYTRVVILSFSITEKLIAKPVDIPLLILRWKKLSEANFNRFGLIHKLMNRMKMILLCKVPFKCFSEYKASEDVKVFVKKGSISNNNPVQDKFMTLSQACSSMNFNECDKNKSSVKLDTSPDENDSKESNFEKRSNTIESKLDSAHLDENCSPSDFLSSLFADEKMEGPGVTPECTQAAMVVLEAVKNDALSSNSYLNALNGNIGGI